jgi:hypothetical protein
MTGEELNAHKKEAVWGSFEGVEEGAVRLVAAWNICGST